MHPKILIAMSQEKDKELFEEALFDRIEQGLELLFATKKNEIEEILNKEFPHVAFIDAQVLDKVNQKIPVVWVIEKNEKKEGNVLQKPLSKKKIIEACLKFLPHFEEVKPFAI